MAWILVITCLVSVTAPSAEQFPTFSPHDVPTLSLACEPVLLEPGTCSSLEDVCRCHNVSRNPKLNGCAGQNCFCDHDCTDNGDCCVDHVEPPPKFPDSLQRPWIKYVLTCHYIPTISAEDLLLYIANCPQNYNDSLVVNQCKQEAESDIGDWPVVGKVSGFLYRNLHCGICNGEFDLEFLNVEEACEPGPLQISNSTNTSTIDDDVRVNQLALARSSNGTCFNRKHVTSRKLAKCVPMDTYIRRKNSFIDTCSPDWSNDIVVNLCKSFTSYVSLRHHNSKTFKNVYCLLCNNYPLEDTECSVYMPTSPIFDIRPPDDRKQPNPPVQQGGITYYPMSVLFDVNRGWVQTSSRVGFKAADDRKIEAESKTSQCEDGKLALRNRCVKIHCGENMVFRGVKCVRSKVTQPDHTDLSSIRPGSVADNVTEVHHKLNTSECLFTDITQFRHHIYDNKTLFLDSLQMYLEPSDYKNVSINDTFRVLACLPVDVFDGKNVTSWSNRSKAIFTLKYDSSQTILSMIGQIISVAALFVLLVVYCSAPSLRNTPGKCLMCLSLSLFLALLLHLVGIGRLEPHGLCYAFAVLIHYFYLASFFWMNIMSFDMFRIFAASFTSSSDNGHKKFLYYNAYGWCAPLTLVVTALVIDQVPDTENSDFSPKYGHNLCFISNRNALLVYFVVPLGVLMFTNFIFFILTAKGIYQALKVASRVRKAKKERCTIFLYFKISVIMGLTWVFGFLLTTASNVSWLTYMFIVLNAFQGLFICVAFLFSKKVLQMCCRRFGKKPGTSSDRSNSVATYTVTTSNRHSSPKFAANREQAGKETSM